MKQTVTDQRAFWNSEIGRNWILYEADLDLMSLGINDLLLGEAAPRPGERFLDVGCGAGATAFACAAAVGPSGHVTGLDISAPMIERAEERRRAANLANVAFVLGDAGTHRPTDAGFDAVVSRFGVMFFADPVAAFRNILAGLRPGGRMVLATWAGPERNPWFAIPRRIAEDRLGALQPTPPEAPGPMAFRDIDRIVGILRAAGFSDCSGTPRQVDLHHPGGLPRAIDLATHLGPAAAAMREKEGTPEDVAAIAAELERQFAPFTAPDGVRVPAELNLYRASRP